MKVLLLLLLAPLPTQDEVTLHSGKKLEGRVLFEDASRVVMLQGSREVELDALDVASVNSIENSLATVLEHLRIVPADNVSALLDLARVCDARGLPREAALVRMRVLLADPENVAAHEALDHRKRGADWTGPLDGKWFPWNELLARRRDWNAAWELETTHYRIRTNLALDAAIDAALDLERFYLFFFDTIGDRLGRRFVLDPMNAYVHGDSHSYIELAGRAAWYDVDQRRLNVNGTTAFMRFALFHEAVHQLLDVSEKGSRSNDASLPAWLSEGLAEYLARCSFGPAGRAEFREGQLATMHVYLHARSPQPIGLTRFLALEYSDFLASEDAPLLYAQAYTLVHMCLHAEGGRYRQGFLDFLRLCFEGRGNPSTFRKHVATDADAFARDWAAYVEGYSGGELEGR